MTIYNTNLASEFYVLSMLYRLGANASLTLGNKKAVDIIVVKENNPTITIDVKGLAGQYDWPADNIHLLDSSNHFYALVSFEGKISDPFSCPSVWVIPADKLSQFEKTYRTRVVISRAAIKLQAKIYFQAWPLIIS